MKPKRAVLSELAERGAKVCVCVGKEGGGGGGGGGEEVYRRPKLEDDEI